MLKLKKYIKILDWKQKYEKRINNLEKCNRANVWLIIKIFNINHTLELIVIIVNHTPGNFFKENFVFKIKNNIHIIYYPPKQISLIFITSLIWTLLMFWNIHII